MTQETNVIVRDVTEDDIPSYHTAFDSVAQAGLYMALLQAPPMAVFAEKIRRDIESGKPHLVAVDGNKVVGWCEIQPGDAATCRDHVGTLSMGLLEDYRGQGLGKELIEETIMHAMAKGMTRIQLFVRVSNTAAVAMYEKQGFAIEGTQKYAVKYNGVYDDLYLMALLVGDAAA